MSIEFDENKTLFGDAHHSRSESRLGNAREPVWQTIPFEGREYIGVYIETPNPTVPLLRQFVVILPTLCKNPSQMCGQIRFQLSFSLRRSLASTKELPI